MISVVATIRALTGAEKQFEDVARELVQKSAAEEGVMDYRLCMNEAGAFVFVERYRDEAAVEAHRRSDHFRSLGRKLGEFMDGKADVMRLKDLP